LHKAAKKNPSPAAAVRSSSSSASATHHFPTNRQGDRAEVRNILHAVDIQPKLTVGAPNDRYEDRVAERVVADQSVGLVSNRVSSGLTGGETAGVQPVNPLQAQENEPEQVEQEEVQAESVQRLFDITGADDEENNVQALPVQRQVDEEEEEEAVQAKADAGKKAGQEGKKLKYIVDPDNPGQEAKEEVQARAAPQLSGNKPGMSIVPMLNSTKGGGSDCPSMCALIWKRSSRQTSPVCAFMPMVQRQQ